VLLFTTIESVIRSVDIATVSMMSSGVSAPFGVDVQLLLLAVAAQIAVLEVNATVSPATSFPSGLDADQTNVSVDGVAPLSTVFTSAEVKVGLTGSAVVYPIDVSGLKTPSASVFIVK
jgi:hypothetical protein